MRDIPVMKQDMRTVHYCLAEDDPSVVIGYENPLRTERPEVASFDEYFYEHLYHLVESSLRDGVMYDRINVGRTTGKVPEPSGASVMDMSLVRLEIVAESSDSFRVDAIMKARIAISMVQDGKYIEDAVEQWFRMPFRCSIATNGRSVFQLPTTIYDKADRASGRPLDQYLVPIIRNDALDDIAEQMLAEYYPEVLDKPMPVDAMLLASRMGVSVVYSEITKEHSILGQFFFEDSLARVYRADTDSYAEMAVKANTMLIDLEAATARGISREEDTIIHECIHGHLDRLAYMLQRVYDDDMKCLSCPANASETGDGSKPMRVIEARTAKLTPRIRMPATQTKMKIEELLAKHDISTIKEIQTEAQARALESVISELATFYRVSKKTAQLRMFELGYDSVGGLLNYVNGRYAPWHRPAASKLRWNQTYTISIQDAAKEYTDNPRFADLLNTGHFLYAEGHFCINDERYVSLDSEGSARLTEYARTNMDECCLLFTIKGRSASWSHTKGALYREAPTKKSRHVHMEDNATGNELTVAQRAALIAEARGIHKAQICLPSRFTDTLAMHMDRLDITAEQLAESSGISTRTLSNWKNDEEAVKSIRLLIALCIGLHLEPEFSFDLIDKGGHKLMKTDEHALYGVILRTMYKYSIYACNAILLDAGMKPLLRESGN